MMCWQESVVKHDQNQELEAKTAAAMTSLRMSSGLEHGHSIGDDANPTCPRPNTTGTIKPARIENNCIWHLSKCSVSKVSEV